jgi:hypothetical protein
LPLFDYNKIAVYKKTGSVPAANITADAGINFLHQENSFQEFDRESLIPHMLSTEGPALAVADINHDGLEDLFIGSAKGKKSAVFVQTQQGKFNKISSADIDSDSTWEDVDACWTDVNNDSNLDLVVASGGNEYYSQNQYLSPRVYLNDGKANFSILKNAFEQLHTTASTVSPFDINGDGFMDLFIGSRTVPYNYGKAPQSYLLLNDKTGRFKDVTSIYAKELANVGFVTKGVWCDIDSDGDGDLVLSLEWGGITAFINENGSFKKRLLADNKGWWNFITACDIDNDGDLDLIAGNLGLNTRLKASIKEEVKMYYNDFDGNGKNEQVITYYVNGTEIPFANKAELEKQMPYLKKKFLYAKDFANASLNENLFRTKINRIKMFTADCFSNAVFINNGKLNFSVQPLPWQAQLTSYRDAAIVDANKDNLPDIFLAGNYYENNVEFGRYDADYGTILLIKEKGICLPKSRWSKY